MRIFTYQDYITSIHSYRLHALLGLAEEGENYQTREEQMKEGNQSHSQLIKNILKNRQEMATFVNQFLYPKKNIEAKDLQRYNNSYRNKKFQQREDNLIYKIKNQEIYFLIEHQSTVDYNITYRILNYCIEIMQEWNKGKKIRSITTYPIIIPVIIYTGEKKWEISTNFINQQVKETTYGRNYINLFYNVIDINRYSRTYFLEKNSCFGYGMLIKKARNSKEIVQIIKILLENIKEEKILLEIAKIIEYLVMPLIEIEQQNEIMQKIEGKVGEYRVNEFVERIKAGDEKRLKQKEREVTKKVTQRVTNSVTSKVTKQLTLKMLQKGINSQLVQEISGLTKEEVQKLQ